MFRAMWPGEQQPGGQQPQYPPADQQHPQSSPYPPSPPGGSYPQSPPSGPYPQSPPYSQAAPQPSPSPYAPQQPYYGQHPAYQQQPQSWGPPPPQQPPGNHDRKALTIGISVVAAVAVIAAGAITAVYLTGGGKGDVADPKKSAGATTSESASPSLTPSPSDSAATGAGGTSGTDTGPGDARGSVTDSEVKPVVTGWQAVPRSDRNIAYDVPKGWKIQPQSMLRGFEDKKGNPKALMGGTATYQDNWCGTSARGLVGSKGGKGATDLAQAAYNEAGSWADAAYNDSGKARITVTKAKPFSNSHGITGYAASATATGVPVGKCASHGSVYTVTYVGKDKEVRTWVLVADTGFSGALDRSTVGSMRSSIREIN